MRNNSSHDLVVDSLYGALIRLLAHKPLEEINISELCAKAGVSRISYYRNFEKKSDILVQYLKKVTDDWWKQFSQNSDQYIRKNFWNELIVIYRQNEQLIRILYRNNLSFIIKDHIFSCCGPKAGMDEESAYTCAMLAGSIFGIIDQWILTGMKDIPENFSFTRIFENNAQQALLQKTR